MEEVVIFIGALKAEVQEGLDREVGVNKVVSDSTFLTESTEWRDEEDKGGEGAVGVSDLFGDDWVGD